MPIAPQRRNTSLVRSLKAVAWSFIGLRRGDALRDDMEKLNPVQLLVVALAAVFAFVLALIALVNWIA